MDKLTLTEINLSTKIGIHAWEQQAIQVLKVDLELMIDAHLIAKTDAINAALDYDKIIDYLQTFAHEHHFQLLETFADKLAGGLLAQFNTPSLRLTVHKPAALLGAKDVSICVERSRE